MERENKVGMQRGSKTASWCCDPSELLSSEQASSLVQVLFMGYNGLYKGAEQLKLVIHQLGLMKN